MLRSFFVLGTVVAMTLGASAQDATQESGAPQPSETTETFGAWTVRCRAAGGDTPIRSCEVMHVIRGQGGVLAQIAIGKPNEDAPVVMVVRTPLGVLVSQPVKLGKAEASGSIELPFVTCLEGGCLAQSEVDAETLNAVSDGTTIALTFRERTGRDIEVAIPLDGMKAAITRLDLG